MFSPMEFYSRDNESFDGLGSKLKKTVKKAVSTTKKVVAATPIGAAGRAIDLTSSRSAINRALPAKVASVVQKYSQQAVATSAAMLTGGASVLLAQRGVISTGTFGVRSTASGLVTGAVVGGAIAGGQLATQTQRLTAAPSANVAEAIPAMPPAADPGLNQTSQIAAGGGTLETAVLETPVSLTSNGTPTTPVDAAQSVVASSAAGAAPKSAALPIAAAAGAGFLVFGPIGAIAGAAAGAFLGRKKA